MRLFDYRFYKGEKVSFAGTEGVVEQDFWGPRQELVRLAVKKDEKFAIVHVSAEDLKLTTTKEDLPVGTRVTNVLGHRTGTVVEKPEDYPGGRTAVYWFLDDGPAKVVWDFPEDLRKLR